MRPPRPGRARGAALLALVAVIGLASSWMLVSRLNAESANIEAARKQRNAEVLNRAKLALIGYVSAQASKAGENNPGALPCPEADGYFDNPDQEGQSASSCTLPRVGRFPWRTLGTEKLTDASGEPLWYVVSPGWARQSGNTTINSDSVGQLTVDGVANAAVALIIAPGPAFAVQAAAGCAAINQTRPTSGTPNLRNYLECDNATLPPDASFVTSGPKGSFNDQVVLVTAAELMPGIEAAIANRIEREIVPLLNGVYTSSAWGFSGANPLYPYPAPFANPGPGAGTSSYQGSTGTCAAGVCRGLLPFNRTQGCTPGPGDPRCTTTFLGFSKAAADLQTGGTGYIRTQSSCAWQGETYVCTGEYFQPTISVTVRVRVSNVAMGLRRFDAARVQFLAENDVPGGWPTQTVSHTASVAMNSDGSATVTVAGGMLPDINTAGWGTYANYVVRIERAAFGDHQILDESDATTGWFARNGWYRLLHYASAQSFTAAQLPAAPACTTGVNCLSVANTSPANNKRALLILAGRSLNGAARPSGVLADYLEAGNATGAFVRAPVNAAARLPVAERFNDRIVIVAAN